VIYFDKLIGKHEGRPAIVICGGPSAPKQLEEIQGKLDNPVLISVNEHGCKLTKCDYSVSLDNVGHKLRDFDVQKITPYRWCDVKLTGYWNASNSGRTACWVAWKMGCTPIVIVGADLYQNGTYWWDRWAHSSGKNTKLDGHLREWSVVPHRVPPEILTCAGGPLVDHDIIQKFDGRRKYPQVDYEPPKVKSNSKAPEGQKIRITAPCWIEGIAYWVGEEPVVRARSARKVIGAGKAENVAQ